MRRVAIVQARWSSTRLPGKSLVDIAGKPMLWHVVSRAQQAKNLDAVVVATSTDATDDEMENFCRAHAIECFRGHLHDVLDRFYRSAQTASADVIVRITGDCPLIDPDVIDEAVARFHGGRFDYLSNVVQRTYPDGLDVEVFSISTLERAWREAQWTSEREHVTAYIYKHPSLFNIGQLLHSEDLSALRWTVDEPEDLQFVRTVYQRLGVTDFRMQQILELLRREPPLQKVNAGIDCNEGYQKSLREDTPVFGRSR